MGKRVAFQPDERAEAARVGEPELARAEDEIGMIVTARRRVALDEAQAARHAEMDQQMAASEFEEQIFAASLHGGEPAPDEPLGEAGGHGVTQTRRSQHGTFEQTSDEMLFDPAPGDFDFREFRHRS